MSAHLVRLRAPAKINLRLRILGKRPDGFHELETIMAATTLADELTIREVKAGGARAGSTRLSVSDPSVPAGEDNLVQRAVALLRVETGYDVPLEIELFKRVPHGAGLGGGSADAAATLEGLNRLARLGLSRERLAALGARLGSDVPFYFYGPVARCEGRGEQVTPWPHHVPALSAVLLFPRLHISTAAVYRALEAPPLPQTSTNRQQEGAAAALADSPFDAQAPGGVCLDALRNDLEAPARQVQPALEAVYAATADVPCVHRMLTGSGSALVFYVEPSEQKAVEAQLIQRNVGDVYSVRTLPTTRNLFEEPMSGYSTAGSHPHAVADAEDSTAAAGP